MIKFGTGGWRAIIGEEFTKENLQKLALAMSLKIKAEHVEDKPVVIGYDRRFLSKEAVIWSCEILGQQGIRVLFVDRSSPTPLIMFYVMKHDLSYGMMVTASHNPVSRYSPEAAATQTNIRQQILRNIWSRQRNFTCRIQRRTDRCRRMHTRSW